MTDRRIGAHLRLLFNDSIVVPVLVEPKQLSAQGATRGWDTPCRIAVVALGDAPRYSVRIAPRVLNQRCASFDVEQLADYMKALALHIALTCHNLSQGKDPTAAETSATSELIDDHSSLLGLLALG